MRVQYRWPVACHYAVRWATNSGKSAATCGVGYKCRAVWCTMDSLTARRIAAIAPQG